MKPRVDQLIQGIKDRIEDPERREALVQLGVDLVEAQSLMLTEPELAESLTRHIKAQALTMTATETKILSDEFSAWTQDTVRALLIAAIGGL